nr:hypothetical protein [uncultured Anaerotignum sp.]
MKEISKNAEHCFFCGETIVQMVFAKEGEPLSALLKQYFLSLKR